MDSPTLHNLLTVLLLTPLASAAIIACFLRRKGNLAAAVSVGAAGVIAAITLWVVCKAGPIPPSTASREWFRVGDFAVSLGFNLNPLAATMLLVVGFVAFWIHLFSLGYMADDSAKARFFGGLSIFMFSMLGIVLADNLFMVFIFWELVGFSSYCLIDHYFQKPSAAAASKKAFITNRVGDFGFLLGILGVWAAYGTTNFSELEAMSAGKAGITKETWLGLALFCGVLGKSAQMPLHVWLPDAMEGPTPVSALIHAATMVAAGVFLLARTAFLFTPDALQVIAAIGTVTALFAAFCAFGQTDIKKILAYSTLSQLGFMVAAFGVGAQVSPAIGASVAMFHLTTHAFFKALMFLGSGSVIHACHHEQEIYQMGGLAKKMPVTFLTFTIGVLAIAGTPFITAGFFSKDAILGIAFEHNKLVFAALTFGALLTVIYMFRLWIITFLGKPRSEHAEHAHESPFVMLLPLIVLAVLSVAGGYVGLYPESIGAFWKKLPEFHEIHGLLLGVTCALLIVGAGLAFTFYKPGSEKDRLEVSVPALFRLSRSKLYFDEIYGFYVARIQQPVAVFIRLLDQALIGGVCVRVLGGGIPGLLALGARQLQRGGLHAYVYWFLAGAVLFTALAFGYAAR